MSKETTRIDIRTSGALVICWGWREALATARSFRRCGIEYRVCAQAQARKGSDPQQGPEGGPLLQTAPLNMTQTEALLLATGLLYAINKTILQDLGLALSVRLEDDDSTRPVDLVLLETPGRTPWKFTDEMDKSCRTKLRKFFAEHELTPNDHLKRLLEEQ